MSKKLKSGFVSGLGRHSSRSLGNDVGLDKLAGLNQADLSADKHKIVNEVFDNLHKVLRGSGLKIGERLIATAIETGINLLLQCLQIKIEGFLIRKIDRESFYQ
jgi:hypothetical protein